MNCAEEVVVLKTVVVTFVLTTISQITSFLLILVLETFVPASKFVMATYLL